VQVAEGAGIEGLGRLNQCDFNRRIGPLQVFGCSGAAKTTAYHHYLAGVLATKRERRYATYQRQE